MVEYKQVEIDVEKSKGSPILEEHIRDGWELHSVYVTCPGLFLLKRERVSDGVKELSSAAMEIRKSLMELYHG